ncbi:MAG: hypothetical protein ACF8PG_10340 [Maioricimonas sp. JB045]
MQRHTHPQHQTRQKRAGLAPLELVLSLPLLLMLMALMIIIGTAGAWKIRTDANSRQAVFRAMWPRSGANDAKPYNYFPPSAQLGWDSTSPSPLASDPYADYVVVRGPVVTAPLTGSILEVILPTLDITDGLRTGTASINHELPLWPRLGRRNNFVRDTQIFAGNQWQHNQMGFDNNARRIPVTYAYSLDRYAPDAAANMLDAAAALTDPGRNPHREPLFVLDRDEELRTWHGDPYTPYSQDRYDWLSVYPPVSLGCDFDLQSRTDALIDRIEAVPQQLAQMFLRMYREQLAALDAMDPPPPNADQLRADLQAKIDNLSEFISNLP